MLRRPPISTRTDTLFPYATLFRSSARSECGPLSAEVIAQLRADADRWMSGDFGRDNEEAGMLSHGAAEEIERLMHVIDRDRYVVAAGIVELTNSIRGRRWICEGRGPYEWGDEEYQLEFGDRKSAVEGKEVVVGVEFG